MCDVFHDWTKNSQSQRIGVVAAFSSLIESKLIVTCVRSGWPLRSARTVKINNPVQNNKTTELLRRAGMMEEKCFKERRVMTLRQEGTFQTDWEA